MDNLLSYADEICKIRKSEKLSQKDLANLTGYSQQAISRIEAKTPIPSLKSLINIIEAMGYELKIVKKTENKNGIYGK